MNDSKATRIAGTNNYFVENEDTQYYEANGFTDEYIANNPFNTPIEVVNMTSNTITLRVITHKVITRTYLNMTMTQCFESFKRTMREEALAAETSLISGSLFEQR